MEKSCKTCVCYGWNKDCCKGCWEADYKNFIPNETYTQYLENQKLLRHLETSELENEAMKKALVENCCWNGRGKCDHPEIDDGEPTCEYLLEERCCPIMDNMETPNA